MCRSSSRTVGRFGKATTTLIQPPPNPAIIPLGTRPRSFSSSIMRKPPRHFRVARGTCSHLQRVLLAGESHLLRHLLCWISQANRFRGNTRKSRRKMAIGVQHGGAEKKRDLLKQVEQVKQGSRRHPRRHGWRQPPHSLIQPPRHRANVPTNAQRLRGRRPFFLIAGKQHRYRMALPCRAIDRPPRRAGANAAPSCPAAPPVLPAPASGGGSQPCSNGIACP
ncbi:MAG: hypothetical protein JWR80_4005 [Bradyrhizobium sp.]|nr:hypothetical protein [Bradyrhizobium sp.]